MATANDLNISQSGYVVFDGTATFTGRTFQAGTGITLTNANGVSGNTTISSSVIGLTWNTVSATTQSASVNNGYVCINASTTTITLPATYAIGDMIIIAGYGTSNNFIVTASSGDTIVWSNTNTQNIQSLEQFNCITLVAIVANTTWIVQNSVGNFIAY